MVAPGCGITAGGTLGLEFGVVVVPPGAVGLLAEGCADAVPVMGTGSVKYVETAVP